MKTDSIARLRTTGVSVWLDDLSRERLTTGSLAALRDRSVSGVTPNPTIFAGAIGGVDGRVWIEADPRTAYAQHAATALSSHYGR